MSLIRNNQRKFLLDEAAQYALQNYDLNLLSVKMEEIYRDPSYAKLIKQGMPLASLYEAKSGEIISVTKLKRQIEDMIRDIKILKVTTKELKEHNLQYLLDTFNEVQLLKRLATRVDKAAKAESSRLSEKAQWSFSENFDTLFKVNLSTSTLSFDTGEGLVFLPSVQTETILTVVREEITDGVNSLGSTAQALVDRDIATSWRFYAENSNLLGRAILSLNNQNLSTITVDPIGYGTRVEIKIIGEDNSKTLNEVLFTRKTFSAKVDKVVQIEVSIFCSSTEYPKVVGIKDIQVSTSQTAMEGYLYTLPETTDSFAEIRLDVDAQVPVDSSIEWAWSTDNSNWNLIEPGSWIPVTDQGTTTLSIDPTTLNQDGVLYTEGPLSDVQASINTGSLEVGENQFEVSAEKKRKFEEGNTAYTPLREEFRSEKLAWTTPDTEILTQTTTETTCPVQIFNYASAHAFFTRGQGLVGTQSTPAGAGLTWLPITGSAPSLQKDHHYRFSVMVFCQNDVLINTGKYFFLQGFKTPNTKTFRQAAFTLGTFTFWVNGEVVCGENYPATLYTDGTCDNEATNGKGFTFALRQGWNTLEVHLYCPKIPSYLYDDDINSEYLQLTISPNVFDPAFQAANNITKVLGSGRFTSTSQFDLVWSVPKKFTYWGWSEYRSGVVVFNTNKTDKIDGFYGGTDTYTYPNLKLTYASLEDTDDVSLYLRAGFFKTNQNAAGPILSSYRVLTR